MIRMRMIAWRWAILLIGALLLVPLLHGVASAQVEEAAEPAKVILDTYGVWRMHTQLAPPVLASGQTVELKYVWLNHETPSPSADWMSPDFDDSTWLRGPVGLAPKSALVSRVCLRGKFIVTDPHAVTGLQLSAGYRGGLVVYVNGRQVHREHISEGGHVAEGPAGEERTLSAFPIPEGLLTKDMNVVGLEVVRAPYPEATENNVYEQNACEILHVRLTSPGAAGLISNAVRPDGFQVWNADAMAVDFNADFGDQAEPLRPVQIAGARNGTFSGKVVVGSTESIHGLKATPAALEGASGTIPAANVRIRYGVPWGEQPQIDNTELRKVPVYGSYANRLGALVEEPLGEFGVSVPHQSRLFYRFPKVSGKPEPVSGAAVPVWITVRVPADAAAGTYVGAVRVEAQGEEPVGVPVELRVADWALPDTQDYRTWVDMVHCPDTLSEEYGVPLWSDEHFEMIAKSLRLIGETGSRTLYIPLLAQTNLGNEQSWVRWVKRGDGYEYDFSLMERYLDLAEQAMGKPKALVFVVWEVYMMPASTETDPSEARETNGHRGWRKAQIAGDVLKKEGAFGMGPMVTVYDPGTQKAENVSLPSHFEADASRRLWKPLFDELCERLRKRGLEDTMMVGLVNDAWPTREEVEFIHDVTGGAPWVIQSHGSGIRNGLLYDVAPVGYESSVWSVEFSDDGADRGDRHQGMVESRSGWNRDDLYAQYDRFSREYHPSIRWRHLAESSITGGQRGIGRLGADYWRVFRDNRGRRAGRIYERYPDSSWRNLVIPEALLAPGPNGPVATDRLEAFREGVQECEARIVIEEALAAEALRARLGPELAGRCEQYLHDRHMMMWLSLSSLQLYPGKWTPYYAKDWRGKTNVAGSSWFLSSGWQERSAELFALAGEVSRTVGAER